MVSGSGILAIGGMPGLSGNSCVLFHLFMLQSYKKSVSLQSYA